MTALQHTAHASTRLAALAGVATRAGAAVAALARNWRNRIRLAELSGLTDRELADIGITRGDLFEAGWPDACPSPARPVRTAPVRIRSLSGLLPGLSGLIRGPP